MKSVLKVKSKNTLVTLEKVEPKYVEDKATEQYLDYINESGNVMRHNGDRYVNTGISLKGPRGAVGPRGLPGKDGITPHIGENGNWYIGEQDTGNKAAFDLTFTETTDPANGHEYVEIGGIKWATMNVGATSETDYGLYFQWGDTQGYTADQVGSGEGQKAFAWSDYKFNPSGDGETFTKYNTTDGKTVLDLKDDAVRANWGGDWRMPTDEELLALGNAVDIVWTEDYNGSGVKGLICTDKTDSSKQLFFPAAGFANSGIISNIGEECNIWSSSRDINIINVAWYIYNEGHGIVLDVCDVCFGFSVRGVLDATEAEPTTTTYTANRVVIPIDSSKNAAENNGVINTNTAVPYITYTENYLVIKESENLHSGTVIVEANLSGKGLCCPANMMYKEGLYYIYPSLPLDNIKDNLKDLILYCYLIEDYVAPQVIVAHKLWFDDFPEDKLDGIMGEFGYDNWEDFVAYLVENVNEDTTGANGFIYTGETFNWNGNEYYLWETDTVVGNIPYIITDTIDYNELYPNSLEADSSNKYCPYVAMLTDDMEALYTREDERGDILIKVEPEE